jgi:hypothetical protein
VRGAFYADGAGAAFDGFECVFDLEDVAVGGEDWELLVGDWELGRMVGVPERARS